MAYAYDSASATAGNVASGTASELANLIQMVITKIPLWIAAFIVILLSFVAAKMARSIVENKLAEKGIEEEHQELQILGGRMAHTAVLTIGITMGLKIAGIDLTTIIAAVAFGIGFALKDMIMNFLAGILILLGQQFAIGDFIDVGGTIGKVVEIQSRVTILQAVDGTKVIVPNADLFKKQVTSFTSNPFRRIELVVGVDYRHDLKNVCKLCMDVIKRTKGVLIEPKPGVIVADFADNGIIIKMRAWVDSKGGWVKVKSEMAKTLHEKFDEHGIVIAWPMRTVVYDKDNPIQEKEFMAPEEAPAQKEAPLPAPQPTPELASNPEVAPTPEPAQATPESTLVPEVVPVQAEAVEEQPLKPLSGGV